VENLHEWRKQAKYLWHGLEVIAPLGPASLEKWTDHAHVLADILGEDHDLAVLRQALERAGGALAPTAALAGLQSALDRRRQELEDEAFALGWRVFKKKPKKFIRISPSAVRQ
jgi:CHAD domain-containing protein